MEASVRNDGIYISEEAKGMIIPNLMSIEIQLVSIDSVESYKG